MLSFMLVPVAIAVSDPSAARRANAVRQQYERWERHLRARIADLHVVPESNKGQPACDVVISFAVAHDDRPANAAIRTSSCRPFYKRAAYRLVRSLGRVGRVPSLSGDEHCVVLKLSYGSAPTATGDRNLSEALEAEGQIHSRRNVQLVTAAANPANMASWPKPAASMSLGRQAKRRFTAVIESITPVVERGCDG